MALRESSSVIWVARKYLILTHGRKRTSTISVWGDGGWGTIVKNGKNEGKFDNSLVKATSDLIQNDWRPNPMPTWVTCVPSLNRPTLVRDFAEQVASSLNLPFINCIKKVKATKPQKTMRNSYKQANNLDGVFEIRRRTD